MRKCSQGEKRKTKKKFTQNKSRKKNHVIQHRKINKTKNKPKRDRERERERNNIDKKRKQNLVREFYQRNGNVRGRSAPSLTNGL
jgi:hypothetical protein